MTSQTVLIRLDKIGDLISTLPVDQAEFLKDQKLTWVVDENVRFICEMAEPKRACFSISAKRPWASFFELLKFLKFKKPYRVIIFQAPWWVSMASWIAHVPVRVGRKSQWHSFLFLNKGLRQSRSSSEIHEANYNWQLIQHGFDNTANGSPPFLKIQSPPLRHLLEKYDLQPKEYVVVHPGMAGSALNWPQEKYNQLIERLIEKQTVVITGTNADEPWLKQIAPRWKGHPRVRWLQEKLSISELVYILQMAKNVVGPSTGVVHLAASSGTPVVGIYSSVSAHHPRRWGVRGIGVKILTPPGNSQDMNQISVDSVLKNMA